MNSNILLVEDNPDDEELTVHALREGGFKGEIAVARDGAAALQLLFDQTRRRPRLILLDLKLAKVHGLEVLRKLRDRPETRDVPVVVLTSSSEDSDIRTSYERGANSYIRKPVQFEDFQRVVQSVGIYWTTLNEEKPH